MITVNYFDFNSGKMQDREFDYPEDAVSFIQENKNDIIVTMYSCVDSEDYDYISARVWGVVMKYVRVYESDCYPEEYITTYLNHCEHVANLQNAGFDFEGCIVKQADIIEELCDCFSYDIETTRDFAVARSWKLHNLEREIYGCIKTDKGLIYVAKMNKDGVLCLI